MDTSVGARQVGEFFSRDPRENIRQMKNPTDLCTIVSIFPKEIVEIKHTIEPGYFRIPAGTYEKPSVLIVGGSSWWRDVGVDQPILEIPVGSMQVAHSVITDYCNGLVGCNMSDTMPGMFFIPGKYDSGTVKMLAKDTIELVKTKQDTWFRVLVQLADSLWARSNHNPLTIAEEMRIAARSLNMNDKEWLQNFQSIEQVKCAACGSQRNPAYPVCPVCRFIDPNHPMSKDAKFAS